MTTHTTPRECETTAPVNSSIVHTYADGQPGSGIGWVADCGHIKTKPWSGRYAYLDQPQPDECVVCRDLWDAE
jgi:hypothetical protein